jgi:hypothetical protein
LAKWRNWLTARMYSNCCKVMMNKAFEGYV